MSSICMYSRCSVDKKKEKESENFVLNKNKEEKNKNKSSHGGIRKLGAYGGTEFTEGEMNRFLRP